jgi:hypothetical protein
LRAKSEAEALAERHELVGVQFTAGAADALEAELASAA